MRRSYALSAGAGLFALLAGTISVAADAGMDGVRILQQQRDQQQIELRLRMQQQQNRALQSGPPAIDVQHRQRELAQQQRQQELHQRQTRGGTVPPPPVDPAVDQAKRDIAAQRAREERTELMQRLD